ncbi:MAG: GHKL domain-containing protein [Gammaproteobacteria bacterium TMED112]|nr:MAG: GHKL domain-containing protein [Gammaproteobacteria bacterium TMED112]
MFNFLASIKISRVFLLSILFLTFIIFIVVTIFSTFIYNNSRLQQVESLYIQAQSINKLLPQYDETISFDAYVDNLSIQDSKFNELRVTIIDENWNVIGDTSVDSQNLYLLDKHTPETRIEIEGALNNTYGSTIRTSESTGLDLIYVAILRDPNNIEKGIVRVALPFDIWDSFFNFFIYPFLVLFFLVIASSSFLSLNVEYTLRRDLDTLLKSTRKAIKGQNTLELNSGDRQLSILSDAVKQIAQKLNEEVEQAIKQRTEFGTVLDSMNQGVLIFNKSQKVRFSNDIALEMFGKHQFFLKEKIAVKQLLPINKLLKKLKKSSSEEIELSMEVKKQEKHFLISGSKMESTNEYILVISDISSLRKLENLRKNLISDISHEIKTPVSVIRAGSETLHSGSIKDPDIASKFTKSILDNSERLSEMIEDLLELEKIEFGGLVLKREKLSPHKEINKILSTIDALLVKKKLIVENFIAEDIQIKTDKESFRSIFSNLLNNAIKYSPTDSKITFNAFLEKNNIVITIKDNGYGIEKNSIQRIFERFYRSSKARAHTKGTGLGLALVKQLSTRIGAHVEVKSKINIGSEFFVSFPDK